MAQESSTSRFLAGKVIPGEESPVKTVLKHGERRRIILENGETRIVTDAQLKKAFNDTLKQHQGMAALKTIRKSDELVSVKIGGVIRGERKQYKTIGAAKAAVTRAYGKI